MPWNMKYACQLSSFYFTVYFVHDEYQTDFWNKFLGTCLRMKQVFCKWQSDENEAILYFYEMKSFLCGESKRILSSELDEKGIAMNGNFWWAMHHLSTFCLLIHIMHCEQLLMCSFGIFFAVEGFFSRFFSEWKISYIFSNRLRFSLKCFIESFTMISIIES